MRPVPYEHVRCQAPGHVPRGHVRRVGWHSAAWLSGLIGENRTIPGETGHVRCLAPDTAPPDVSARSEAEA